MARNGFPVNARPGAKSLKLRTCIERVNIQIDVDYIEVHGVRLPAGFNKSRNKKRLRGPL